MTYLLYAFWILLALPLVLLAILLSTQLIRALLIDLGLIEDR